MARSCDDLANRLAEGPPNAAARCTADEINLAIACRLTAESFTGHEPPNPTRDELAHLAPATDLDHELSLARELLTDVDPIGEPIIERPMRLEPTRQQAVERVGICREQISPQELRQSRVPNA